MMTGLTMKNWVIQPGLLAISKEESTDTASRSDKEESVDFSDMPPLEGDEGIKRIKRFNSKQTIN